MTGFKQLAYVSVIAGVAFAAQPTGKYGLSAESISDERHRAGANPSGVVNPSDYRADSILKHRNRAGTRTTPKPAEPMPPTSCRSVEPVPTFRVEGLDGYTGEGAHGLHWLTAQWFGHVSDFGPFRMALLYKNSRGVSVASPALERVELVSLLTDDKPSVYVFDEMPTMDLARQAKRRPLDEFERLGLEALRRGEGLVWTREAPTRMIGAIHAWQSCVKCHTHFKEGDLLGAFTYYLNTPVDQLGNP
jgi:hypothetical protein